MFSPKRKKISIDGKRGFAPHHFYYRYWVKLSRHDFSNSLNSHHRASHKSGEGFTLTEILIVIGILSLLTVVSILVINPVEYLKQGRDAKRLSDVGALKSAINFANVLNSNLDFDGPNYANSCKGESSQRVFVSVPSGNGETPPTLPAGWTLAQVSSSDMYHVDGTGWLPINLAAANPNISSALPTLPADPTNTFTSGLYYSYVCGSYEINVALESLKQSIEAETDGGDDPTLLELGSWLFDAPARSTSTSSPPASLSVSSVVPGSGVNTGTAIVSVGGAGFQSGATVKLTKSGQSDIVGSGFSVSSTTLSTVSFNISGAATGDWNIVVTNPDAGTATCTNCFTVSGSSGGTVTATFTYDSGLDGFVNSSCTHLATCARITSDGNPGLGSLEVNNSTKNKNSQWQWDFSGITWESLGVPPGAVVTSVDGKYNHKADTFTFGDNASNSGDLIVYKSNGSTVIATLENAITYSGTTSWAMRDALGSVAIPAASQPSNTNIILTIEGKAYTNNTNGASVILRQDQIVLTITYQ